MLIDAHVHFHACFDEERFFVRAAENFAAARRPSESEPGFLLLTESAGVNFFRRVRERGATGSAFTVHETAEAESIEIRREGRPCLVLIAGRQVATAESLEVLALGCEAELPDGRPIGESLGAARERGALPVVPWGFGKWWLARGAVVARLLENEDPAGFFLGDNGGRPRVGRRPRLFAKAEARGFRILPGSDPLPFPHHGGRAGSFGFRLQTEIDPRRPAAGLKAALTDVETRPVPYGRGERLLPFFRNQLAMQWVKR